MKIFIVSLGCSKNLVDTEVMLGCLARRGCMVVEDPEKADCFLVNTCAFLLSAVEESLDRIIELARMKGKRKRLVVAGCLVSRYGDEILKEIPEVDALVSPADLPAVIAAVYGGREGNVQSSPGPLTLPSELSTLPSELSTLPSELSTLNSELFTLDSGLSPLDSGLSFPFPPRYLSGPPHRAYLKIGEGCSNRCAFCLIPDLRGEFASRSRQSLMAEMDHLARSGIREVTLVAQDSGSYGMDGGEGSLPALLESLLSVREDHFWLRTLYVHPRRVTDELLTVMGSDSRICRYLDIPFQHVSPGVLGRMGRS
ncbi:MAG: radical SAM protein, partial [Proteobacteria bacterium]|nr:radical SAM protein [Pseudomonadota bacterium]